jgi:hypothetical protein
MAARPNLRKLLPAQLVNVLTAAGQPSGGARANVSLLRLRSSWTVARSATVRLPWQYVRCWQRCTMSGRCGYDPTRLSKTQLPQRMGSRRT